MEAGGALGHFAALLPPVCPRPESHWKIQPVFHVCEFTSDSVRSQSFDWNSPPTVSLPPHRLSSAPLGRLLSFSLVFVLLSLLQTRSCNFTMIKRLVKISSPTAPCNVSPVWMGLLSCVCLCSPVFLLFLVQRRRWSVRYVHGHVGGSVSSSLSAPSGARGWTGTNVLHTNKTDKYLNFSQQRQRKMSSKKY